MLLAAPTARTNLTSGNLPLQRLFAFVLLFLLFPIYLSKFTINIKTTTYMICYPNNQVFGIVLVFIDDLVYLGIFTVGAL